MGFTVEDRYLLLPTYRTLKVLHLAKSESHRLNHSGKIRDVQHNISDFSHQEYQL